MDWAPKPIPSYISQGEDEGDEFNGVKLLTGEDGTAVEDDEFAAYDLQRSPDGRAIIGDHRNDENRIVSQLQLAMIRFHNEVAEYLREEEEVEGEELFEEARRLTTWHYQYVVVEDYLPEVCGQAVVNEIQGQGRQYFCPESETPFIPIEFAVAAYRYGHSMMPQTVQVQRYGDEFPLFGPTLGSGFEPVDDPEAVVNWDVLVDTPGDNVVQQSEQLDTQMASLLLNLPFINEEEDVASLATRNLLRSQVFLLPSGEEIARAMNRDESEIERISEAAQELAEPEVNLENGTPLWFYILVEAERKGRETEPGHFESGEGLGPVGARIVAETLYGLIELDERSYLSTNRNWNPTRDGVGVTTLGEMLTYAENPVPSH
jgi:Animal haem peroxidase.